MHGDRGASSLLLRGLRLVPSSHGALCRWSDAPTHRLIPPAGTHEAERSLRRRYPWLDRLGHRLRSSVL